MISFWDDYDYLWNIKNILPPLPPKQWRRWWSPPLVEKACSYVCSYWWWNNCSVSMSVLHQEKKSKKSNHTSLLCLMSLIGGCSRQSNSTRASGSSDWQALHSELQCFEGTRRIPEAGSLAGRPEPDPAELPAWQQRQCEWPAARGARLLSQGHLSYHHSSRELPWWRLLHLHLWPESLRFEAGTDVSHCFGWVNSIMVNILIVMKWHLEKRQTESSNVS